MCRYGIICQSKVKVNADLYSTSRFYKPLTHSRDHLSYGITQCYLPPDRGDSHDFTPGIHQYLFYRPMKGGRHLGTAGKVLQPVPKTAFHSSCCDKRTDGGFSPAARYARTRPLRPARRVGVSNMANVTTRQR